MRSSRGAGLSGFESLDRVLQMRAPHPVMGGPRPCVDARRPRVEQLLLSAQMERRTVAGESGDDALAEVGRIRES